MRYRNWLYALAWLPLAGGAMNGAEPVQTPEVIFRSLKTVDVAEARARARDWLEQAGKKDQAALDQFTSIWKEEIGVLDRVARTFALGDAEAARLLREAADPDSPAPTELPAIVGDESRSAFFRANFGLAYARALAQRRVHEEALAVLARIKPDQVVDPASYYFYRAVAEHAMNMRDEALASIRVMKEDVADAPDRYQRVAQLMMLDMQNWNGGDALAQRLGNVARKMSNIERRLDLARGGPHTQDLQKRVVVDLDELIKMLEQEPHGPKGPVPPGSPDPGEEPEPGPGPHPICRVPPGGDTRGPGNVDDVKLRQLLEQWGNLPPHKRAEAMAELTRGMAPRWASIIEKHARDMARGK